MASWTALIVVAASLVAYALSSDGFPTHKADLNDGGVWVVNQEYGAVGRQNVPVAQIDGQVSPGKEYVPSADLDVLQNAAAVVSVNTGSSNVIPIDVTQAASLKDQKVQIAGDVAMGGSVGPGGTVPVGVIASVEPGTGALRAQTFDPALGITSLSGLSSENKPMAVVGPDAKVTVAPDGTIFAASGDTATMTTIRRAGTSFAQATTAKITPSPTGGLEQMTTVGDHPVLLDKTGHVITGGNSVDVGEGSRLQDSGLPSDSGNPEALVSTDGELWAIAVDSGKRRSVVRQAGAPGAPVQVGSCSYAAWYQGGSATVVQACGDSDPAAITLPGLHSDPEPKLVFRVNRNQLVLNDVVHGTVWRINGGQAEKIDDWRTSDPKPNKDPKNPDDAEVAKDTPPKAVKDTLGSRVSPDTTRTTILHVLDNDTSPVKAVLAVVGLDRMALPPGILVRVAPDQQSVLAEVRPGTSPGDYQFRYSIDDGRNTASSGADAVVTLKVTSDQNSARPTLRQKFEESEADTRYASVAGGVLQIPVLQDWRDEKYGDPVQVKDVEVVSGGGTVAKTPQNLLRFTAPSSGRTDTSTKTVTLKYHTTTGGSGAELGERTIEVRVVGNGSRNPINPDAKSDVAAGVVGGVVTIKPLDNDVPGADPTSSDAELAIVRPIDSHDGWRAVTDPESGVVRIYPTSIGSNEFTYQLGYGNADRVTGKIRVIADRAADESNKPVPGPDQTSVYGTSPATIDVLANDFDPQGRLLAVTDAKASSDRIQVAVIDGRWLRVSTLDPDLRPANQSVSYTVSNGVQKAEGSLSITLDDPLTDRDAVPITEPDRITVRVGDIASAPVLDNDSTPSGDPIELVADPKERSAPGTYTILQEAAAGPNGPDLGTAYLSGRRILFVAPKTVDGPTDIEIQYRVGNVNDAVADYGSGSLYVHITPEQGNQAPTPRGLEGRVVQGDTVTLKLPAQGLDPDGDSVSVTGVGDQEGGSPRLGRIVGIGADSIQYQAFPGSQGTDEFGYTITDRRGLSATGKARVAVVPPGPPQPPVALNDSVTADTGRKVVVDVLANDLRTPGTQLSVEPLIGAPSEASLDPKTNLITVQTPDSAGGEPIAVPYTATNGLDSANATLTVNIVKGFNNPPVAADVYAHPEGDTTSTTVDVLANVYDIDGDKGDLKLDPIVGGTMEGDKVVLPVLDGKAQVFPYRVTDADGGSAVAAIYVPAKPKDFPHLKAGAGIKLKVGQTKQVPLSELAIDPEGEKVTLTTTDQEDLYASPQGSFEVVRGKSKADSITVTAGPKPGPASLTFTVVDRSSLSAQDKHVSVLSVPVQIGDDAPVVTCPGAENPVEVGERGQSVRIAVASVCHVWTSKPASAAGLEYTGDWRKKFTDGGLDAVSGGFTISTGGGSAAGMTGEIAVGAKGHPATASLFVKVVKVAPPSLSPITREAHAEKPVRIDLASALSSGIKRSDWNLAILDVTPGRGADAVITPGADGIVTITPNKDTHGTMLFRVRLSDVGEDPGLRPAANGIIRLDVASRPDAPTGVQADTEKLLSHTVKLSWTAPNANGARIEKYLVSYEGNSGGAVCQTNKSCLVKNLVNGRDYHFRVAAVNKEDTSEFSSAPGALGTPDESPTKVRGLTVVSERNLKVNLSWTKPLCDCSDPDDYLVSWPGHPETSTGGRTSIAAVVGQNGDRTVFTVKAVNRADEGVETSITAMGSGKPDAPAQPTLALTERPASNTKGVVVRWNDIGANGRGQTEYQVFRAGVTTPLCGWQKGLTCLDELPYDGSEYSYKVQARNDSEVKDPGFHMSGFSPWAKVTAAFTPDAPTINSFTATGNDNEVQFAFTANASHGGKNTVECLISNGSCGDYTGFSSTGGGTGNDKLTGPPNGSVATLQLRSCNGSSGPATEVGESCSPWATAQVTPYGPLRTPTISANASGDYINVDASWNANGKDATVTITESGTGAIASFPTAGASSGSYSRNVGRNVSKTYTITITDSGRSPSNQSASASATTPPPDPTVSVSQGNACTASLCPGAMVACASTCYNIKTTGANFTSTARCQVFYRDGSSPTLWDQGNTTTTSGGNWIAPNLDFEVRCNNGTATGWTQF